MLFDSDINYVLSLIGAKAIAKFAGLLNKGATALPGHFIEKLNPSFLKVISDEVKNCILVTGTNGKTTTSSLIVHLLTKENKNIGNNHAGSNLKRGIISSIIPYLTWDKKFSKNFDYFVFECDEFALEKIVQDLAASYIVMLNLFRDQLDRYGEIDTIRKKWSYLISNNKHVHYIVNADDPSIASLFHNQNLKVSYFGVSDYSATQDNLKDVLFCPICGGELEYNKRYFSHIGDYFCTNCDFKRPKPNLTAKITQDSEEVELEYLGNIYHAKMPIKGTYNVYNIAASYLACVELGYKINNFANNILDFKSTFGRYELINYNDKKIFLILVKNPVGFTQALESSIDNNKKNFVFILNDNIADGRDVSWIWDVNFGSLKDNINELIFGGSRMFDMALRIKYEDIGINKFVFFDTYRELFNKIHQSENDTFHIFLTYTALLELKNYLSKQGFKNFYER
ncbi:putative amino acid ligase found clustered with an amidotransferase [Desulfurella amilsii]|uniref:Lipid II isoglutaminyl synthase (glutamine-hydrolyzing) subunit MurT n=1 Tax=Desulfurella amilsii TaxID=1562698 RepID=A0A1X4XZV7_9BACT|nr:MurT ligase domain-containing protein [Desulfurella amilsii]OSS43066.1 putative amino acid ligase found clustered with an amidotransferase [Desulfurella amilsii]